MRLGLGLELGLGLGVAGLGGPTPTPNGEACHLRAVLRRRPPHLCGDEGEVILRRAADSLACVVDNDVEPRHERRQHVTPGEG